MMQALKSKSLGSLIISFQQISLCWKLNWLQQYCNFVGCIFSDECCCLQGGTIRDSRTKGTARKRFCTNYLNMILSIVLQQ